MRVEILDDACEGCGMCVLSAPEVFGLDSSSHVQPLLDGDIPAHYAPDVAEAIDSCPMKALRIAGDR